ncbi:MAG: PDZ domain-containing protein, partial [Myxococcales bacterium]|nr:PDZ domain-containing protein [Myxococcales bacterium]
RTNLGTVPDYGAGEEVVGVRLSGVRPDGPADRAGIRRGDVIVGLGATEIRNLYDYTFALRQHKPGETATLRLRRDGREVTLPVTFGSR